MMSNTRTPPADVIAEAREWVDIVTTATEKFAELLDQWEAEESPPEQVPRAQ